MRAQIAAGILFAIAFGLAEPAAVAETRPARKRPRGSYRVGPAFVKPRVDLLGGVDTNVYGDRTYPIPDTTGIFRPSATAVLPLGARLRLSGEGFLQFSYYRREASQRSTDFGGETRLDFETPRLSVFASAAGAQVKERYSIEFYQRLLRQERTLAAGGSIPVLRRLRLGLTVQERHQRLGDTTGTGPAFPELADRIELLGRLEGTYRLTRLTSVLGGAELIEDQFPAVAQEPRRSQSRRVYFGAQTGSRALLRGRAIVGLRDFPGTSLGLGAAYRGPIASVSLAAPLRRVRLDVEARRDVEYSLQPLLLADARLQNTYVSTRFGASAAFGLPFDLVGRAIARRERADYVLPYIVRGAYVERVDRLWLADLELTRALTPRVRLGGYLGWSRLLSNVGAGSTNSRYGVRAEWAP